MRPDDRRMEAAAVSTVHGDPTASRRYGPESVSSPATDPNLEALARAREARKSKRPAPPGAALMADLEPQVAVLEAAIGDIRASLLRLEERQIATTAQIADLGGQMAYLRGRVEMLPTTLVMLVGIIGGQVALGAAVLGVAHVMGTVMDSFGYTIFVFVPILALVLGGIAWAVQTRANRRIDALLSSDHTAGATNSSVFGAGPVSHSPGSVGLSPESVNISTGSVGLSGNAYVVKSSTMTAQYDEGSLK